jgi:hypothetical protein
VTFIGAGSAEYLTCNRSLGCKHIADCLLHSVLPGLVGLSVNRIGVVFAWCACIGGLAEAGHAGSARPTFPRCDVRLAMPSASLKEHMAYINVMMLHPIWHWVHPLETDTLVLFLEVPNRQLGLACAMPSWSGLCACLYVYLCLFT